MAACGFSSELIERPKSLPPRRAAKATGLTALAPVSVVNRERDVRLASHQASADNLRRRWTQAGALCLHLDYKVNKPPATTSNMSPLGPSRRQVAFVDGGEPYVRHAES